MINFPSQQKGLAALELLLIAPVLLSLCYIMLRLADSAALWEQRIIESRNAAYRTELYNQGKTDLIDSLQSDFETTLLNAVIIDNDLATTLNVGSKIKRYSEAGSKELFKTLINDSRAAKDNKHMRPQNIRNLTRILDTTEVDSTIGIGFTQYTSPVGNLRNFFLKYQDRPLIAPITVLKEQHVADFANTIDLGNRPSLCLGYDDAMNQYLNPGKLYTTIFPRDSSRC